MYNSAVQGTPTFFAMCLYQTVDIYTSFKVSFYILWGVSNSKQSAIVNILWQYNYLDQYELTLLYRIRRVAFIDTLYIIYSYTKEVRTLVFSFPGPNLPCILRWGNGVHIYAAHLIIFFSPPLNQINSYFTIVWFNKFLFLEIVQICYRTCAVRRK